MINSIKLQCYRQIWLMDSKKCAINIAIQLYLMIIKSEVRLSLNLYHEYVNHRT